MSSLVIGIDVYLVCNDIYIYIICNDMEVYIICCNIDFHLLCVDLDVNITIKYEWLQRGKSRINSLYFSMIHEQPQCCIKHYNFTKGNIRTHYH